MTDGLSGFHEMSRNDKCDLSAGRLNIAGTLSPALSGVEATA